MLDGSAVDHGVDPWSWQTKTRKLVYTAFTQSIQHYDVRPNGWLEVGVIGPSGMTFLKTDYCFSELVL